MTKLKEMMSIQLTGDPDMVNDFADQLSEMFINPLAELGFEFEEYSYAHLQVNEGGVHVLEFDFNDDDHINSIKLNSVNEICTQDDDSQPAANYRLWMGTLWLFIPYKA